MCKWDITIKADGKTYVIPITGVGDKETAKQLAFERLADNVPVSDMEIVSVVLRRD